ncbi:MAG: hypothetical protein EBZ78_12005 [Verrucomicrobia bacterium]|nr:hypothetical protein [Verrucomicrobiota bacterium]
MANKLSNVSILTIGEAKGHNLLIDQKSLEQALEVANSMKRIKVTMGHGAEVSGILGYIDGFRIEGERLMGDLTLFNTNEAQFVQHLAQVLPEGFGLSLTFSGVPEEIAGDRFARVDEIFDISVVSSPAANSAGLFSAFCAVDMKKLQMNEASVEVKKEEIAPAVVAEVAAPAVEAPVVEVKAELAEMPADKPADKPKEKMAEPTLTDIAGMLAELLALMKADATQDITEAPEAPAEDMAKKPMPSEMSAKSDDKADKAVTTLEKAKADAAGAVAVPAESSQPLGRAEILNQFNAEKSPARRSELLRKLGL